MGEIAFVGAGLEDERGLSARAWEVLRRADVVFAEEYTSCLAPGSLDRLSAGLGRPVHRLGREEVESGRPVLDALGSRTRVALVVPGDPFAATTHVALRLACEEAGHTWTYWPNASVYTAAGGFLGLMPYRFGRTVSLPFPEPGFAPTSPLDGIAANRGQGLHTLVLLDLRPSEGRFLLANEALGLLEERDPDGRVLPAEGEVGVVARVGSETAAAWWGTPRSLRTRAFGPPLHCVVVPAPSLHFEEAAAVARFRLGPGP